VILGVYAFNEIAFQGVVMQMLAHAVSTGALFILAGQLNERIHTRDISKMGGLWNKVPFMGAMWLIFAMASLGLPGLGNFIAEFLILAGSYKASIAFTCVASVGLIAATLYSLRIVQKIMHGKENTGWNIHDLSIREKLVSVFLVVLIFYLGLWPQKVIDTAKPVISKTLVTMEQLDPPQSVLIK